MTMLAGSRRLPCGHGTCRVPETPGQWRRICKVCATRWTITVAPSAHLTRKLGRNTLHVRIERTEAAA